jgi:electron transfer flavoprotein-quinone oxidoreductase
VTLRYDVVVVGAGPAGSSAALVLARLGLSVALVERGPFPGAKNLYGGVLYLSVLDELLPHWRDDAPIERVVTRRSTVLTDGHRALTFALDDPEWARPPYNGVTARRSRFDRWLATQAVAAGAHLYSSTTVIGLLRNDTRILGVQTDRTDGEIYAKMTIAADGVNSFMAREAGLYPGFSSDHLTLGYKEVIHLGARTIDDRFGLEPGEGADLEVLGCVAPAIGGGFCYTNDDTVAIGVIASLPSLAATGLGAPTLLTQLKDLAPFRTLLRGGTTIEVGAHLIPEGGWRARPTLSGPGIVVVGDAASLCLASGLWLEGVNMAIGSGKIAGETVGKYLQKTGEPLPPGHYDSALRASAVGHNLQRLQRAPGFVLNPLVQHSVPLAATAFAHRLFAVDDHTKKPSLRTLVRQSASESGIRLRTLGKLAFEAWRAFK